MINHVQNITRIKAVDNALGEQYILIIMTGKEVI